MLRPEYKDTALMCRSFASRLIKMLRYLTAILEALRKHLESPGEETPERLQRLLNDALNGLALITRGVRQISHIGAERTEADRSIGEILGRVEEEITSLRIMLGLAAELNISYDDGVDSSLKIPDADVLHHSIVRAPVFFLQAMDGQNVLNGQINILVGQEEEFVTLRISCAEVPLVPESGNILFWSEEIRYQEATMVLPFARYLLETRGGSLTVADGSLVFKLPTTLMLRPEYKDTALMCRSLADQIINKLLPVGLELQALGLRNRLTEETPDDLRQRLNNVLNGLALAEEEVKLMTLIGAEETSADRSIGEILDNAIQTAKLSQWDFNLGIGFEATVAYAEDASNVKILDADVLYQATVRGLIYLVQSLNDFLLEMKQIDILQCPINILAAHEEGFVILRMSCAEAPLAPEAENLLSWPEGVEYKEIELPFARYLLETRGGSLTVADGAFVFKLPAA